MFSSVALCAGEDNADASLYSDPAPVPGCPVDGEDEPILSGTTFCSHPHHPSAHAYNRQGVLCHRDEMCKYLSVSVGFNTGIVLFDM